MKRAVEFPSEDPRELIRAGLFTPDEGKGPWPVIGMGGGWCDVKELIMPEYAQFFLRDGLAALIFDYRCLGASDGEPRQHLDPWKQIADYRAAVDALSYLDEYECVIDRERIGVWGISYSGGHALIVGALDPRVTCVVSQIPIIEGWYHSMREDRRHEAPFSAPGRRPAYRPAGPNATRARLPRPDGRPPAPGDTLKRQIEALPSAHQDRARPRSACQGQLTGCVPSGADGHAPVSATGSVTHSGGG